MNNKPFVLTSQCSIANHFLAELRDAALQKDRMRFRRNMERLGEILAYEMSRVFSYEAKEVRTPLGEVTTPRLVEYPILVTILRAGIPFHQGFLNIFDQSDSGFIGAYREEETTSVVVNIDYVSVPPIDKRVVVIVDPMLATGNSIVDAYRLLLKRGTPSHVHVASVVSAPEGIKRLEENLSGPSSLWTCAIDEKLNPSFYIVPGLGDAGDLSYGIKQ
mgnify:CR=1 FL=1